MAEAVVSMVVERLGDFLIEEAKLIHGVSDQVRDIRDELWWIQCFLKDADARHHKDHRVRTWIREIKEIAYDAGDVLESFILKVESKKGGGILNILKRYACIVNEGTTRHKVGSEILAIEARISKLTARLQMYGVKYLPEDQEGSNLANQSRLSYSHVRQDDFVGMKEDVDILVERLVDHEDCKVVSIWGMGGSGKTTLARQVFNHEKVRKHFDASVWVCISERWQHRDFFREILTDLLPNGREEIKTLKPEPLVTKLHGELPNPLVTKLHGELQGKTCLIVLDDIWGSDPWDSCLKKGIPIENMKGKLLLTSRSREVASHVNPRSFTHEPGTLQKDEGWDLLKRKALTNSAHLDREDLEEMEKLGKKMITQCGCLPLAIVVLGGILVTKPSLKEWKKVNENVTSYIKSGEGIGQRDKGVVMEVLSSSYDDLPYQLKPCFLYLGKFAEDSEIEAEKLYQLWMAESMVLSEDQKERESIMDVAERYLGELSQRCMVQVQLEENHEYGSRKFKSCRLHDLMRVLCLSKAKDEDFFKVFEFPPRNDDEDVQSLSSTRNYKPRRVVIFSEGHYSNCRDISFTNEVSQNLRSMLFFGAGYKGSLQSMVKSIAKNFRFLRVLAIEGLGSNGRDAWNEEEHDRLCCLFPCLCCCLGIPCAVVYWLRYGLRKALSGFHIFALAKAVGILTHLRYLSLRNSNFSMILLCLSNLKHLQTLDLRGTELVYLSCMQNALRKMTRLQYLYLPKMYRYFKYTKKLRLDGLSNLETLDNFNPCWCEVKDLSKLVRLQRLKSVISSLDLKGVEGIISYLTSPQAKHMIYSSLSICYCSSELAKWHMILVQLLGCGRLHKLKITGSLGHKLPGFDDISMFSSSLTMLSLDSSSLEEDPMPTLERLPNLQSLSLINNAFSGEVMVCSDGWFRQLKSLNLSGFSHLKEWRVEKGALRNLSSLRLQEMLNLETVPDGLRFIDTLQELRIRWMHTEFTKRVQAVIDGQKGEDFERIGHVRSIITE